MKAKLQKSIRAIIFSMPIIAILTVIFIPRSYKHKAFINDNHQYLYSDSQKPDTQTITFYALGDWGTANTQQKMVAKALREDLLHIEQLKIAPFVLGLGDNIYPDGLPNKKFNHPLVTKVLQKRFGQSYRGTQYQKKNIVFHVVPGNHDYHQIDGRLHEETTAEFLFNGKNDFPVFKSYPIHHKTIQDTNTDKEHRELKAANIEKIAFPQAVIETNDILIIALDTPLYLKMYSEKSPMVKQHWDYLRDKLNNSPAKWKLIFGHHPISSYGTHSGFRSLREWTWTGTRDVIPSWLRPFTFLWFTSLSVVADKTVHYLSPYKQDLNEESYQRFIQDMNQIIQQCSVDFYVAGHDHNLQFLNLENKSFQVISGSAGKLNAVHSGKDTIFSQEAPGFVRFDLKKRKMFVKFFAVDINSSKIKVNTFCIRKDKE